MKTIHIKEGQKYILPDLFKAIEKEFLNRKEVSFNSIDYGSRLIIEVDYKKQRVFNIEVITSKGLVQIVKIDS